MVNKMTNRKVSNKGFRIIVSITIAYVAVLLLLSKILLRVFPDKPTEWYSFLSFVVSPFLAVIIGLVFLKITERK